MTIREERLQRLQNALPASLKTDKANAHAASYEDMKRMGIEAKPSPYQDYLAGWNAAMELRLPAFQEENDNLHRIILALVSRQQIKKCDGCDEDGFTDRLEKCELCGGDGWIDTSEPTEGRKDT